MTKITVIDRPSQVRKVAKELLTALNREGLRLGRNNYASRGELSSDDTFCVLGPKGESLEHKDGRGLVYIDVSVKFNDGSDKVKYVEVKVYTTCPIPFDDVEKALHGMPSLEKINVTLINDASRGIESLDSDY